MNNVTKEYNFVIFFVIWSNNQTAYFLLSGHDNEVRIDKRPNRLVRVLLYLWLLDESFYLVDFYKLKYY